MSFLVSVKKNRSKPFVISITEDDGDAIVLADDDVVRVKVSRGADVVLDISSAPDEQLPGGSRAAFTTGSNQVTLYVCQDDTADLQPGAYDVEVNVVDGSETDPPDQIKHAESGVFMLHPSAGGDISDEQSSSSGDSSGGSSGSSSSSSSE